MPNLQLVPSVRRRDITSTKMIAVSPAMCAVVALAERVARTNLSVVLHGETGSGKDVLARHIHEISGRTGRFVAVNCAALPTSLAESELFGHVRGAFTGAERSRDGVFEQADKGTLFLDEIGDLDLGVQAKLLRVIEDGQVQRVGGSGVVAVDTRIIAASHRDLSAAVAAGRFRDDFYHRLAGIVVVVPPLRERREDILPLVERFMRETDSGTRNIAKDVAAWLEERPWPGNVRELRQAVRRAAVLGGVELRPDDFGVPMTATATSSPTQPASTDAQAIAGTKAWRDVEREVITAALVRHGSLRAAAAALGRPKSTVHDRARALGIRSSDAGTVLCAAASAMVFLSEGAR